ncbi:MAG TPA: N-acetylmuramoyl-L-alanine amidase [bacterium]|jgi:N-acetylmuramoyl-L-alanine amidase|nr:N-acetylmuramoyl-L-alanine amidase [bacterium]
MGWGVINNNEKVGILDLNKLFFLFVLFQSCVWADDITIELTPTNSPIPPQIEKVTCIVIDPGNGGKDFGAIGYDGKLLEKNINLIISKKVMDFLKKEPGLDVLLTRQGDNEISDKERVGFANSHKADLFISIHCNRSESDKDNGAVIYCFNFKNSDKPAAKSRETNGAGSYDAVFSDLRQNRYKVRSEFMAEMIEQQIKEHLIQNFRSIQRTHFYVLDNVEMPSLWIGTGYITNKGEANKLQDPSWQSQMAKSIAGGILAYRKIITDAPVETSNTETKLNP